MLSKVQQKKQINSLLADGYKFGTGALSTAGTQQRAED